MINVLSARHERAATIITSNLAFSEWNRVFGDDKLTAALLDRRAQHADVRVTRGPGDRVALPQSAKTQTRRCRPPRREGSLRRQGGSIPGGQSGSVLRGG